MAEVNPLRLMSYEARSQEWRKDAACRELPKDVFFALDGDHREAKRVCSECPVRQDCLDFAIDSGSKFGVYGGLTPEERGLQPPKLREPLHNRNDEILRLANETCLTQVEIGMLYGLSQGAVGAVVRHSQVAALYGTKQKHELGRQIKRLYSEGWTVAQIGLCYGMPELAVRLVLSRGSSIQARLYMLRTEAELTLCD